MKEILITSSVLILAILAIRQLFRGVLSRRIQYALWALVALRLLIPGSLFDAPFSLLRAARPVEQAVTQRLEQIPLPFLDRQAGPVYDIPAPKGGLTVPSDQTAPGHTLPQDPLPQVDKAEYPATGQPDGAPLPAAGMETVEALGLIWKAGMALMGGFFLLSNLSFYFRLRKNRKEWQAEDGLPHTGEPFAGKVYLVPQGVIPSPCLFGRAIYITPAVAADENKLRHVLTHEATHARHRDPIWSLVRCVCLTVYWFDPLVWVAATCSKTDCELACDEGALKALGEDERIGYGRTLLALIPVRQAANPMLAATTMTAGKRTLAGRITRIAKNPRPLVAATLVVALLSGGLAACTFTGAGESPEALRPLTGKELLWFNTEFFNSSAVWSPDSDPYSSGPQGDTYYNIRNQFANPINLYEKPEDIHLNELLYLEGSAPTDEELKRALDYESWDDLPCPAYKLTTREINDILTQYTGLTLAEINKDNRLTYTYDEATDAYYWMHGDTNYCGDLEFLVGTREGDTVKLYHSSKFVPSARGYCVTLTDKGDGQYWFVSNQECDIPAIPPALPTGEPLETVSLKGLKPYEAPKVTLTRAPEGDFDNTYENRLENWDFDGHNVVVYRSVQDGRIKAAIRREDGAMDVFLNPDLESGSITLEPYYDLFGHIGFALTYRVRETGTLEDQRTDFFYLTDDGTPVPLFRTVMGILDKSQLDMDGDGQAEFVSVRSFFFQRRGKLYKADLTELLQNALPEPVNFFPLNPYGRYYSVQGGGSEKWKRFIFFDGESLLVYSGETPPTPDNMAVGVAKTAPTFLHLATLPLQDTKPVAPGAVEVRNIPGDDKGDQLDRYTAGGDTIRVYRPTGVEQTVYAGIERSDGTLDLFLEVSDPNATPVHLTALGQEHILAIGYWDNSSIGWPVWDFYVFRDHMPVLLCRSTGGGGVEPQTLDLDGDGIHELITQEELFFLRDGSVCRADLKELVQTACPELDSYDLVASGDGSCFRVFGYTGDFKTATRSVYFDGEKLLVYKIEPTTVDHMIAGVGGEVPAQVVKKAKESALTSIVEVGGVYRDAHYREEGYPQEAYDDWRISQLNGPFSCTLGGVTIDYWTFNVELHTTEPEKVVLAGARTLSEDNWTSPGPWNTPNTLFFRHEDSGDLTYLWTDFTWGDLNSTAEREELLQNMEAYGIQLAEGSTYPQLWFEEYLGRLTDHAETVRLQYDDGQGGGGAYMSDPQGGNSSYYLSQIKNSHVIWGQVQAPDTTPTGATVTLSAPDWYDMLQFWQDSGLVMYKMENRNPIWFEAVYDGDPTQDVYAYRAVPYYWARCWYDNAQYETLAAELPLIPDSGQSYLNIAQEWAEGHEGIKARLSPGGSSTCTFVKVTGVGTLEDMPESWFPADILAYPHFAFTYDVAFVPENQDALNTLMAGNTVDYEGSDPDVPQGAYTYSRRGSMYLKDGHWYCAGVGTG